MTPKVFNELPLVDLKPKSVQNFFSNNFEMFCQKKENHGFETISLSLGERSVRSGRDNI